MYYILHKQLVTVRLWVPSGEFDKNRHIKSPEPTQLFVLVELDRLSKLEKTSKDFLYQATDQLVRGSELSPYVFGRNEAEKDIK